MEKLKIIEMVFKVVYTLISAALTIFKFISQVQKLKEQKLKEAKA